MKHVALWLVCACACGLAHGQVTAIQAELVADHNTTGIPELAGMKTYHVFAQMTNAADEVSAVFGDSSAPLSISSTDAFYQSALGANFGWRPRGTA